MRTHSITLKNYDATESIIGAAAKSLEGDCYVNLKQYPQAIECYKSAVKISDNNPTTHPRSSQGSHSAPRTERLQG